MGLFDIFKADKGLEAELEANRDLFSDNDVIWFCIKHGLSLNRADYAEDELQRIKLKALEEKTNAKQANRDKLNKILNN